MHVRAGRPRSSSRRQKFATDCAKACCRPAHARDRYASGWACLTTRMSCQPHQIHSSRDRPGELAQRTVSWRACTHSLITLLTHNTSPAQAWAGRKVPLARAGDGLEPCREKAAGWNQGTRRQTSRSGYAKARRSEGAGPCKAFGRR
eukprot:scaffold93126_cov64-Phaeocystis_antarctica.AAC.4